MAIPFFDTFLDEIRRRAPEFLSHFPLELPSILADSQWPAKYPALGGLSADDVRSCLDQAVLHWSRQGIVCVRTEQTRDPVGEVLFASLLDGLAADRGGLPLPLAGAEARELTAVFSELYDHRSQPDDAARALFRRKGIHNLVLINAVGIPATVWTRFLQDDSHPFRIILIESRNSDLLTGGMRGHDDVSQDALRIARVLEHEAITGATVVAWCNGGRIALELAAKFPERVASLVLLSTTSAGFPGTDLPCSAFEASLEIVFKTIIKQPKMARHLAATLQPQPLHDWNSVAHDPVARAKMLFRLPALEHSQALFAPFATEESLMHYARRCLSDLTYDIEQTMTRVRQPILLITGESDDIVNNQLTLASLRRARREFLHVDVRGAGHYIADLQYPYFLWALNHWHTDKAKLMSTARAQVERISD